MVGDSDYAKGKMDDMYSRMGNAILKEIRDYDKQEKGTRGSEMTPKEKTL